MKRLIKNIIVAVVFIIAVCGVIYSINENKGTKDQLLQQIKKDGLSVLAHTSDNPNEEKIFSYIYPKIASGADEWIEIGYQIRLEGAQYNISKEVGETINQPLGEALKTNPQKVFSVIKMNPPVYFDTQGEARSQSEVLEIEHICATTADAFDDSGDPIVTKRRIDELSLRREAVEKMVNEDFAIMKAACLESIDNSIKLFSAEIPN